MNSQKQNILISSGLGVISTFIPWFKTSSSVESSLVGFGLNNRFDGPWIFTLFFSTVIIILALIGKKSSPTRFPKTQAILAALIILYSFLLAALPITESDKSTTPILGIYLSLSSGFLVIISIYSDYIKWIIGVSILLALAVTLPFHYVSGRNETILLKENFTFSNTFINDADIEKIISRFNKTNLFEQAAIRNEPLIRKLIEANIIVDKGEKNHSDY